VSAIRGFRPVLVRTTQWAVRLRIFAQGSENMRLLDDKNDDQLQRKIGLDKETRESYGPDYSVLSLRAASVPDHKGGLRGCIAG